MAVRLPTTLLRWAVAVAGCAGAGDAHAAERFVWFGTYTNPQTRSQGIYVSRFDDRTGALGPPRLAVEAKSPSFLAVHPRLPIVAAVSEGGEGGGTLGTFSVDAATGALRLLDTEPSGAAACHVNFDRDGTVMLAAHYGDGSAACLGVDADGGLRPMAAGAPGGLVRHAWDRAGESGIDARRQERAHAHSVDVAPDGRFAFVCNLGLDQVLVHALDRERATLAPHAAVKVKAGAGPRHFALHPDGRRAWCVNELDLTVTAFTYDPEAGTLALGETLPTLPADVVDREGFSTAEIAVHPTGKFLYASNRGHHSIAMYVIDPASGRLTFLGVEPIRGRTPRSFAIDPTGRFLLAAGQDSNTVTVFTIDPATGRLAFTGTSIDVPSPVCIVFGREPPTVTAWSDDFVADVIADARAAGDARRGARVFHAAATACTSCHKVGDQGGAVGPELTTVAKCLSAEEIVESLYWPARTVKPEYRASALTLADGRVLQGIVKQETPDAVTLVDASGKAHRIAPGDVEERIDVGSLMPQNVFTTLPADQRRDLVRYLLELGRTAGLEGLSHRAGPFDVPREPLRPDDWPNRDHPVNAHRLYDAYTRQALMFRGREPMPLLLPAWPGLDGGGFGHWGVRPEAAWNDGRRNLTDLGSLQCWPLKVDGRVIPRAVNLRLGDDGSLCACFNPETLAIEAVWSGGFLTFDEARYGFMAPAVPAGPLAGPATPAEKPRQPFEYHGFYRHGRRVVFSYRLGDVEMLDAPWVKDGVLVRDVGPADGHPLAHVAKGGAPQWPQVLETTGSTGSGAPYAVDTIAPPFDNPWRALLFFGGVGFFSNGDAALCTMQGDVWRVSGLDADLKCVGWRRIASGLNQALGLVVADDVVFVLGGDQLTRLDDVNGDGEADRYVCVSNRYEPSGGHNFKCGLERDAAGNFFAASHQGLLRISPDGRTVEVLAVGFRNPDGIGLLPDGTVTVPVSEGEWTPASAICAVPQAPGRPPAVPPPNFKGTPPALPLAYLPRGVDNSCGGQVFVSSDRWGPLGGLLVHLSFGTCTHLLVLRDEVDGRPQGAVVPLPGDFRSGVHRGRFSPADGQLYACGMTGWQSYAVDEGCFQRVRYVGGEVRQPVAWRAHRNGVRLTFSAPLDREAAGNVANHFAQCWNYRFGPGYGSPEFSPSHYGTVGHDPLPIRSATVLPDGRSLFLEIPDLQPVNQLHLHVTVGPGTTRDVFATVHALDEPFREIPDYLEITRPVGAHPILRDVAMMQAAVKNPWLAPLEGARPVAIEAASNLAYKTTEVRVAPGEKIALTFVNPDVVPHNWVLTKPGTLAAVGALADGLIADPEAVARHYVPKTDDVLAYVDVTEPGQRQTIHFTVPDAPGRYPFLCTFPGHWRLMNGVLIVEEHQAPAARARELFRRDNLVAWCIVPFDGGWGGRARKHGGRLRERRPIGILNHTGHDAEARLLDNLEGLDWVVGELTGKPIPKPTPRTR